MPRQATPLTGEEQRMYEVLVRKSVRSLREEAKQAKLSAGAKMKAELVYSMVKEKKPRRKHSNTPEDSSPSPSPKGKGLDGRRGIPCPPSHGIASNLLQQLFPPKFPPVQLLADGDKRADLFKDLPASSEQIEDTVNAMAALDRTKDQFFNEILKLCRDSGVTDQAELAKNPAPLVEEMLGMGTTVHTLRNVEAQFVRYFHGLLDDEFDSAYRADKEKLKEDAEKLVACTLRAKQLVNDSEERYQDEPVMAHHRRRQDYVSIPESSHPSLGCTLRSTTLELIVPPRGPRRSHDDEAERARLKQSFHQSPLHDECLACGSSEPVLSSAERGRREYVIDDQGGWPRSAQRLEQSPLPHEVYDTTTPSAVIYHPSPVFSILPQLSYKHSASLVPVQRWSPTPEHLSTYPVPSYEEHASEPVDRLRPPLAEPWEGRTLPPMREVLSFLSWLDHPEAAPPFAHLPRTRDR